MDDDSRNNETEAAAAGAAPASPEAPTDPQSPPVAGPSEPRAAAARPASADPAPPGWWLTPEGRWQPPPWQPPPGWWQAPNGQWQPPHWYQAPSGHGQPPAQPPWPTQQPPAQPPWPAQQQRPAAPPPSPGDGQTFGVSRGLRPGQVPWHWRDVLFAALVALGPIAALTALGTISSGGSGGARQTPTAGFALAAIVSTVIVDGWLVFWAWFFSLRKYRLSLRSFGFRSYEESSSWAVAAGIILGGMFATTILGTLSDYAYRRIVGPVPKENVVSIFPHTSAGLALFVVLAVLVAPLLEETFFRGFVFQGLARSWGPLAGAVVSALIFALWHQQLSVLIPIFGLALLLAAAFYWTKSIYTNIAFHGVFNALGIVAWWFIRTKG